MQTQFISQKSREVASIIVAGMAMLWAPVAALAEATWSQLVTANSPSNVHHDATYDSANQRIVLCGRRSVGGTPAGQAESYFYSVAGGWQAGPAITSTGGADIEVSYDPDRAVTVLYTLTNTIPVVFELVGNVWTQRSFATLPVACEDGALMRYDPVRRKTVLVGITNLPSQTAPSQTWLWDGTNWTQAANSPPGAAGGSMTFDSVRGVMVLLPYYGTNTWTFNGSVWTPQPATNVPIPGVWVAKMAYDPVNEQAIEFGGEAAGPVYPTNTWAWNGSAWQTLATSNYPPGTIDMAFLWFPPMNAIIMHGGWGPAGAWAWRNSVWVFSNAPALASPQGVVASDGTYQDKVAVTWLSVTGATGYRVYRGESNDTALASMIGPSGSANYDDTSATEGTIYYYWVKATNSSGISYFSGSDSGYRSGLSPAAPGNVAASDGTFTDKVQVTWSAVSNATGYTLWRSGTNDTNSASFLAGGIATTNYDDTSSVVNVTNYYWVKTTNANGASAFSSSDAGWRSNAAEAAAGPIILANGQADSITIGSSNTVAITVAFGLGNYPTDVPVDWWVIATANFSAWYYMNSTPAWVPADFTGNNYSVFHPVYHGPLMDLPTTTVLSGITLPPGMYSFWFAVDYPADGVLDPNGAILYDQVAVNVQ